MECGMVVAVNAPAIKHWYARVAFARLKTTVKSSTSTQWEHFYLNTEEQTEVVAYLTDYIFERKYTLEEKNDDPKPKAI